MLGISLKNPSAFGTANQPNIKDFEVNDPPNTNYLVWDPKRQRFRDSKFMFMAVYPHYSSGLIIFWSSLFVALSCLNKETTDFKSKSDQASAISQRSLQVANSQVTSSHEPSLWCE